jgi:hypothetical protein
MRFDGLDMVIEMKNSKNRLIRPSSSKMVVKLCSDEEYRRTCSDDPDDIDEALDEFFCGDEPNLTEKIRDGLYCCYSTKITARHLLMIGGTAENIMIKTHNISGCVRSLGFFNKISIFQPNITTQLENVEERILIISESKRVSLNGYTRVRKNELHNYFRPKDGTEIKYNYDNTNIGREVFDVSNFAQFDKLTAYSRKLYNVSIDPKIKTKMKFLEGIVEIQPTEKQMKLRTEIENYIANIIVNPDGQVIDNIKKFVGEFDSNSLKTKLSETINSFEVIPQPTAIDISSDVDLIQDEKILSESNVFSQHILNKLIRGDVRLKKSQKVGIKAMMVNLIATYKGTAYIDNVLALKVIIDSFMADSKEVRSNSDDQVFDDIMEFLDSLTKEDYVSSPRPRAENENFILDISFLDKR